MRYRSWGNECANPLDVHYLFGNSSNELSSHFIEKIELTVPLN
jgi:hypothetical protein